MASKRYKQFLRLIEKWPLDTTKGQNRDIGILLRKRFNSEFKDGEMTQLSDPKRCDKMLTSLENIVNDKYKLKYKCDIEKGIFGGDEEQAHSVMADEAILSLKKGSPFLSAIGMSFESTTEAETKSDDNKNSDTNSDDKKS